MKILDVDLLHDGLTRNMNRMTRLEQEMTAILQSVEELVALDDALKGEGGQAIRDFYQHCHVPFLQYFLVFNQEFHFVLEQAWHALASLEPSDAGHMMETFLDGDVQEGLNRSANITRELTDEANAIMDSVSDIVGLPHLDDSRVQVSIIDAKRKRDETLEALYQFDQTQTNQLASIETSIQSMKEWVQNIEGLFTEGVTDVNFPSDKWSGIAANSDIVLKLSAMGVETGIQATEAIDTAEPVDPKVESVRAWYDVVGDVLTGIIDGLVKAIVDIFEGLFDMLKSLFTDPGGFFGGLATAIMNPIDTVSAMWGSVETAWNRDVINGNAHTRAEFFSYAVVSIIGLKGIDKVGKAGKVGSVASKVDNKIPYNAMQTDKLKDLVKSNVYTNMLQKGEHTANLLKNNFSKEAINKSIQAAKNSQIITNARNTLDPSKIKEASKKIYEDAVKAPIAKTQNWMQNKKDQILDAPLPNLGPIPLGPSPNMTVRDSIDAAKDNFSKIVGGKEGGLDRPEDKNILEIKDPGQYFAFINEIGKRDDLTNEEKIKKIHEAYNALEQKGDVTVVSDMNFLMPEGFGANGRMLVDWPPKMGFVEESIQSIDRNNPLPEKWDRVGGKGGENFTTLPDNNIPYSYDQRAIPYLDNPSARHVGIFKNELYFDAIDAIKDEKLEELNKIVINNGKNPISEYDFDRFKVNYSDFQDRMKVVFGGTDTTYGLKGKAAPWVSTSTGEKLLNGGAEQIVTPLNAEILEMIGVIPKY